MSELQEIKWYVVHTYSGHENKVKATIEKAVKTRSMEDCIVEVVVPTEEIVETTKSGKDKTRQRKVFPGYVLIKMIITDESWYVVRNTKGVTGFVGPGSKPVPLSEEEVEAMGIELNTTKQGSGDSGFEIGDAVEIINGYFKSQIGTIEKIDVEMKKATLLLDSTGNHTHIEIEFENIEKI